MQFKTSAEIKAAKEASGKSSQQEEKRKEKLAERASRKYARMAEESAKREAARKKKPAVTVLPGVIVAPALLAERQPSKQTNFSTVHIEDAVAKRNIEKVIEAESKFYGGKPVPPEPVGTVTGRLSSKGAGLSNAPKEAKQVWDEKTKQWVKKGG